MNAKWPHHDSPIYQALGRNHALAIAIDGIRYIEIRPVPPIVNPWRHVATRQKHFAYAAELWDCEALDPDRRPFDVDGSFDWQHAMMDHDRAHGYFDAARNCWWGV
jgi:hypothetical protein